MNFGSVTELDENSLVFESVYDSSGFFLILLLYITYHEGFRNLNSGLVHACLYECVNTQLSQV